MCAYCRYIYICWLCIILQRLFASIFPFIQHLYFSKCNIVPAGQFPLNCFQMFCSRIEPSICVFPFARKTGYRELHWMETIPYLISIQMKRNCTNAHDSLGMLIYFRSVPLLHFFFTIRPHLPRIHTNLYFILLSSRIAFNCLDSTSNTLFFLFSTWIEWNAFRIECGLFLRRRQCDCFWCVYLCVYHWYYLINFSRWTQNALQFRSKWIQ